MGREKCCHGFAVFETEREPSHEIQACNDCAPTLDDAAAREQFTIELARTVLDLAAAVRVVAQDVATTWERMTRTMGPARVVASGSIEMLERVESVLSLLLGGAEPRQPRPFVDQQTDVTHQGWSHDEGMLVTHSTYQSVVANRGERGGADAGPDTLYLVRP